MPKQIAALFLLIAFALPSLAQENMPTVEHVSERFYATYDANVLSDPRVGLEKKKNEWWVTTKKYVDGDLENEDTYLFYSAVSKGFLALPLKKKTDSTDETTNTLLDEYSIKNYQLHNFYGYAGWYKDVIEDLSGKEIYTEAELYSLARAYSAYAAGLISNQNGDGIKAETFKLLLARNCIARGQLHLYDSICSKAIMNFKQLAIKNPNFETIVGKIGIKHANEIMTQFYTYLIYADSLAHSFVLPDKLYPDSLIEQNRKVLENCPQNAILLSLGDNDFYPIIYLQQKKGIRKDVYLINLSLLGLDRYIFAITHQQFNAPPIRISLDTENYVGRTNDYAFLKDTSTTVDYRRVIELLKSDSRNEYGAVDIPSRTFRINRLVYEAKMAGARKQAQILISVKKSFILKNELIFLDILNNLQSRRLCCATPLFEPFEELNKYFKRENGIVFIY